MFDRKKSLLTVKKNYLGFEFNPNKGLSYTTNRTILIRNSEVLDTFSPLPWYLI